MVNYSRCFQVVKCHRPVIIQIKFSKQEIGDPPFIPTYKE